MFIRVQALVFLLTCAPLFAAKYSDRPSPKNKASALTLKAGESLNESMRTPLVKQTLTGPTVDGQVQRSNYVLYPTWSPNAAVFGDVTFWTGMTAGNPAETGTNYDIGFDTHLMHGFAASDGSLIAVGQALIAEGAAERNMVVVKVSGTDGSKQAVYKSTFVGDDVAVCSGQFGNFVMVAGFSRARGGVSKRTLLKLNLADLSVAWKAEIADANSQHSTYEGMAVAGDGIWIGGTKNNVNGQEFTFKSAGNIPQGAGFAAFISADQINAATAPTAETYIWSDAAWTSVKALDVTTENGVSYVIATLHKEVKSKPKGGLVKLTAAGAASAAVWGPKMYPSQTEITDVAVAPDGSGYIVTGHGSVVQSGPAQYYGRFTRIGVGGEFLWTQNISLGNPAIIYTECWSVQPAGTWEGPDSKAWVASCAAGIEGPSTCNDFAGADKTNCAAGIGDPTPGAPARAPATWTMRIPALYDSATSEPPPVVAEQMASFLGPESNNIAHSGSSAAEWIAPIGELGSGKWFVTTDEVFGCGFMKLQPTGQPTR